MPSTFCCYKYFSNIYLIQGDYLTLVDTGNDYTAYMQLFREGFNPAHRQKIVLTHGHRDHSMGIFELLRYPSVKENPELEVSLHKEGPAELKELLEKARGMAYYKL